ncbi:MAG: transposase, partial [Pseudomonadota bacterium]|nr:transposase [Pseudomonadota bacterium]
NVLWSPSYFASSCGGAPINIIEQYIKQQETPIQEAPQECPRRPHLVSLP